MIQDCVKIPNQAGMVAHPGPPRRLEADIMDGEPVHPRRSALARVGFGMAAAVLASLLVISAKDLVAGFGGSQRGRTDGLFADTGQQGDIITGETQILLDARAMHVKLSEDLSALDRIIGKGVPERTSSLLKSSAAARIIAKADQVRAEASKLVGAKKGHRNQGLTLGGTSKTAELQLALSTAKKSTTSKQIKGAVVQSRAVGNPFAHDKKWSVHAEKEDMNNFFDNLDHHAAVKEAAARKNHQMHAAKMAKEERVQEQERERRDSGLPPILHEEHAQYDKAKVAMVKQGGSGGQSRSGGKVHTDNKSVRQTGAHVQLSEIQTPNHDENDFLTKRSAVNHSPQEAKKAEQHKILGMSADALRQDEAAFFDKLRGSSIHKAAYKENVKAPEQTLSDKQARSGVESYFDRQLAAVNRTTHATAVAEGKISESENLHMTSSQASADLESYFHKQQKKASLGAHHAPDPVVHKMSAKQAQKDFEQYFQKQTLTAEAEAANAHKELHVSSDPQYHEPAHTPPIPKKVAESQESDRIAHSLRGTHDVKHTEASAAQAHPSTAQVTSMISDSARGVPAAEEHAGAVPDSDLTTQGNVSKDGIMQSVSKEDAKRDSSQQKNALAKHAEMQKAEALAARKKAAEEIEGVRKAMDIKEAESGAEDRSDLNEYYSALVEKAKVQKKDAAEQRRFLEVK